MSSQMEYDTTAGKIPRRFATLVFITAFLTYGLIVFGGVVRITGSGMGCGDDWPLCNGQLIPPMGFQTMIEYGHRLAALLVSVLVLSTAAYAIRHRRSPGIANRGIVSLAVLAAFLLIAQVMVGAVTVWLELPTASVVLHLTVASALLAVLIVAGLRAGRPTPEGRVSRPWVLASAILGFIALLFGGLVANTGAAPLCQGFPLCNGQVVPEGGGLVHLHWTHRLLGYALLLVVAVATVRTLHDGHTRAGRWGVVVLMLVGLQIVIAAAMVLLQLPASFRGLHLAVGTALWAALVIWAVVSRREAMPTGALAG